MTTSAGTGYVDILPRMAKSFNATLTSALAAPLKAAQAQLVAAGAVATRRATLPIVAALGVGVKGANDLAGGLREVVTLTGETGAAADEAFGEFAAGVEYVSGVLGIAQETLVGGLYQALSAGVPRENAFVFLQVAAKAAIAGVTDTETAVDGLTTIINAFGLDASEAAAVADSMFTTVKGGKTTFEELSGALFQVAPTAASLGVGFTEVNAALAALTAQGVPTSEATTRVRAAMDALLKKGETLRPIFRDLGYESAEAAIRSEGLKFALDAVNEASGGSAEALLGLLGRTEAVQAVQILAGTGAEKFAAELAAQADAAGATQAAFDEIDKSRSLDRFKVSLQNLGIAFGQVLLPFVEQAASFLTRLSNSFRELSPDIQKIVVAIAVGIAAIGPILTVLGTLAGVLAAILSPIGLVAVALAGIAYASGIRDLESLKEALSSVADTVRAAWSDVSAFVEEHWDDVKAVLDTVAEVVSGAWSTAVEFVREHWDEWVAAWHDVRDAMQRGFEFIRDRVIVPLAQRIAEFVAFISSRWDEISEATRIVADALRAVWEAVGDELLAIIRNTFETIVGIIEAAFTIIQGVIDIALGLIRGDWQQVWDGIKAIVQGVWDAIVAVISGAFEQIGQVLDLAWETVILLIEGALHQIGVMFGDAWAAIVDAITSFASTVGEKFTGLVSTVVSKVASIPTRLAAIASTLFTSVSDAASTAVEAVVGFFAGLPDRLEELLGDILSAGVDIGSSLLDGIIEGLGAIAGAFGDVGRDIVNALIDAMNTGIQAVNDFIPDKIALDYLPDINLPDNPIPTIPRLHSGGIVPGQPGEEVLALLEAGERVISVDDVENDGGGRRGGGPLIDAKVITTASAEEVVRVLDDQLWLAGAPVGD